tara:strand:- start:3998 stop:5092 length:1095 start_codon:yes stop_codon:yes gene_type:complete
MQRQMLTARSPAKLILSGEHSVLYGSPAIAFAINKYVYTTVSPNLLNNSVLLDLLNFKNAKKFTLKTLKELKYRLQDSYTNYQLGKCSIKDVLQTPFDLINFTVTNLIEAFNINLPHGFSVKTISNVPIGCGMGSSAATIMSLLYALCKMLNLDLTKSNYLQLAKDAENLQHGKSSGLDLYLSMQGGSCLYQSNTDILNKKLNQNKFYIVNTGEPTSTTGDAVSSVRKYFEGSNLADDFAIVTNGLDNVFSQDKTDLKDILKLIQENHKLLNKIQVVPDKVNNFIHELEQIDCAAKICGSGAINGDNAGAVIVFAEDINKTKSIIDKYNYNLDIIEIDHQGSHLLPNNNYNTSDFSELQKVVSF